MVCTKRQRTPILWCAFTLFLLETHRSARSVRRGKSFSKSYRLHTRGWAKLSKSYYRSYLLYLILRSIVLFLVNTRYPSHLIFSMQSNEKHSNKRSMFTFHRKIQQEHWLCTLRATEREWCFSFVCHCTLCWAGRCSMTVCGILSHL